jgi:lipopolysaccharide export system protein LptC
MTQQADQIRNQRVHALRPGGGHDRLVRTLAIVLPIAIGAVAAVLLVVPLLPRGEVSFLLDRNKVQTTQERLRVDSASYRGQDKKGRAFVLEAKQAAQRDSRIPQVAMNALTAKILLSDGPAQLTAPSGVYDFKANTVQVPDTVDFTTSDGYRLTTGGVSVDLKEQSMVSDRQVTGTVPAGTFSADRISADLDARVVTLKGRARLRMIPGKLRTQ